MNLETFASLALASSLLLGCDGGSSDPDAGAPSPDGGSVDDGAVGVCTGDERLARLVYYGTPEPTQMPLSPGQVLAIGEWDGCSGAFVTDEWVLTAQHCEVQIGRRFCVGTDRFDADVCFTTVEVQDHPDVDMTLARMDAPASSRLPALEPIPVMDERIDESWFGTILEAAGYGTQEDDSSGEREFTAEPLVEFEGPFAVIDGMGVRGVCFGDSGGPLMVLATDGTVRVVGALSYGDPSCVGRDRYTRTDLVVDWIESHVGPTVATGGSCAHLTAEGDCLGGSTAAWCEDDRVASERCADGTTCGWDASTSGYRCIAGEDPCGGISATGECRGEVATWCDRGVVRRRDCAPCGEVCGQVDEVGGAYCMPDPCAGLGQQGECRGDIAVWCSDGEVEMQDCSRMDLECGFINDRIGYFCGA